MIFWIVIGSTGLRGDSILGFERGKAARGWNVRFVSNCEFIGYLGSLAIPRRAS